MSNNVDVSVIMSIYNTEEKWLRECIESILNQTFHNFEFIIVLDAPTDGSVNIVREYEKKDNRIVVIQNTENLGLTKNLNKGLAIAKGKYIARMDADDIAVDTRFEKQFSYMELHPDVVATGGRVYTEDDKTLMMYDWEIDADILKAEFLFHNAGLPHPTAMIRKETLDKYDIKYDERNKKSQDYGLWIELLECGRLVMLPDIILMYRVHEGQISANRNSQYSYAHQIAVRQAEKLLGKLTTEEEKIHCSIADIDEDQVKPQDVKKYMKKLIHQNNRIKMYDRDKFSTVLHYLWIYKALQQMRKYHKISYLLDVEMLYLLTPSVLKKFIDNEKKKKAYRQAIEDFKNEYRKKNC